ncbi:BTAD domain-containing putative transcriptional regulator [Streptacidiphilus sp. P02-A3a]|uniref:AfsR/SARP family transcriptional regulator n=1 Tax=Streptacidiphilus sp. P02-A3a TaxID=2704468 RepID=UPI0015FC1C48|nr:BTAD domain-containing putative transcriptional regulator [Streptacidiphilus sp. P02-A3a]QMU67177.1 tetratricopeptide repeat protein [Streptacidiphilus sp. P02-A3a]
MEFSLLGTVEASDDAGVLCPVPRGRLRNLLAALLVHADAAVSVDALAACVWGEEQLPRRPREALQVMVVRLRKHLGPEVGARITSARPGYRLLVQPGEVDLHRFEELLRRGSAALATQDWPAARDLLGKALAVWRGDPLSDVRPGTVLDRDRDALADLRLRARIQLIEARLRLGGHAELVADVAALVQDHPFDEQLRAQLMLALYGCGRRAEALEAFQSARRTFVEELGIEPGVELRELHRAVLVDSPRLGQWAPPGPAAATRAPTHGAVDWAGPAQLPADLADFTGRVRVVAQLEAQLAKATGAWARGPLVLSAVNGAGGIGKTSLAVHVAHRVAGHFPDGQLHADLHGTGGVPAEPGEVLARFLRGLGFPPEGVPADLEERGALYRTTLAARRVLVLLDNVRDAAQVRPLLPGSSTCAVLITSRSTLPGLDGASRLTLDFLDPDEALALFTHIVGCRTTTADLEAVHAVLRICAGLPLAIRIAAGRLGARTDWSVQELARRMADERLRLGELAVEDRAIRTSFAVSYRDLTADQARAFRLLGLAEGPSLGVPAAAALLGLPTAAAEQVLEALADIHLLESPGRGRYQFHDLLRLFAAECAQASETPADRDAAVQRSLGWYLASSAAASRVLQPTRRHVVLDPPDPRWPARDFDGFDAALAWCETERGNLVAAVAQATRIGSHEIGWKLPITMWDLFHLRRWHEDNINCNEAALASARALDDREATAWVLNSLSAAYQAVGRLAEAADCLDRALEIRTALGDLRGEGSCLINLGYVQVEMDRAAEAVGTLERALDIFRAIALPSGEATAQTNLGEAHQKLGDFTAALRHQREALRIHAEQSDEFRVGRALTNLAETLFRLDRLDEAADHAARGHQVNRMTGNQVDEGIAWDILGQVHAARGHYALARQHWQNAHAVLDPLSHPRAVEIGLRLAARSPLTDRPAPTGSRPGAGEPNRGPHVSAGP